MWPTAEKINEGTEVAILSIGHPGNFIVEAQEQFNKLSIKHRTFNEIDYKTTRYRSTRQCL